MVRHKSYVRKCLQCGKDFVSTRYDAKFDTGACKSKWHRENKDNIITAQSELINAQSEILSDIMPKPKPDSIPKITNGNELFCGDVLREINKMVSDARDAAEADGKLSLIHI